MLEFIDKYVGDLELIEFKGSRQLVAIFRMGLPSLLALTRALLAPEFETERPLFL
jgi:hypothetical protein